MNEATIQKIIDVKPIENSDFLDAVTILGWQVVTRRGEFKIGDYCVYIMLDSIVPEKPEFEFLRKDKFRIKTKKLRGSLSQGIVFPLEILGDALAFFTGLSDIEGTDVSEILGVIHYEKPIPAELRGLMKGNFIPCVPKTDEPRIQNYPAITDELKGIAVYATCKMDGTSWTGAYVNGEMTICTRNNMLKLEGNETNSYVMMAKKYDLQNKFEKYGKNIALQGELCGPGIQKNHIELKEHQLFLFNVYFIDEQRYGDMQELIDICKEFDIPMVPIVKVWNLNETMVELLEMAEGIYPNTKNQREGIVIRPVKEMYSNVLKKRASFKCLNNLYLLKHGE